MFPFSNIEAMSSDAILATSQAMLKIAQIDGLQPPEVELIRNFYQNGGDLPAFESLLEKAPVDLHLNAHALANTAEKETLLALCVMVGYADGELSPEELAAIQGIATDLEVPVAALETIIAQVKDFMLAQLAHLPDAASVAKVAHELG